MSSARKVSFLIDTGTPKTILSERDAHKLGVDFDNLERTSSSMLGIGGFAETYHLRKVTLIFFSENGKHEESLPELLLVREPELSEEIKNQIPSILGRDLLSKFTLHLNPQRDLVLITDQDSIT
jgi:hypothetical protein